VPLFETVWSVSAASIPLPDGGAEVLRPLTRHLRERGRAATAAQFAGAMAQLNVLARRALVSTAEFDVLMCPSVAMLPRPVGWFTRDDGPAADFERQKQYTPYTAMFNLTGQPAISLPLYRSPEGLPVGIMFVGRPGGEPLLLALAAQLERALPWPLVAPTPSRAH
jgi:amidase